MKNFWDKLFWSLAPFAWGIVTLSLAKISYSTYIAGYTFWVIRIILFLPLFYYFFGKIWHKSHLISFEILSYKFKLNTIWIYLSLIGIGIFSLAIIKNETWHELITASIIFSPIMEELISKSIFLKYSRMKTAEFLFWNSISAIAFSLMHFLYLFTLPKPESITLLAFTEKFWQHFFFSFTLCFTVFVTKRLDLIIWLHILGNFFGYTLRAFLI